MLQLTSIAIGYDEKTEIEHDIVESDEVMEIDNWNSDKSADRGKASSDTGRMMTV